MRLAPTPTLLAGLTALVLGGCGVATTTSTSGAPPPAPERAEGSFPLTLPGQTVVAFSLRSTTGLLAGTHPQHRSVGETLAVTRDRTGYVACRAGAPLHSVGTLAPATVARFSALLRNAHLATIRSDPVPVQGRVYWFDNGARTVALDFARHVHRAPCHGTMCAAMIDMDAALRAVLPATVAFTTFIGSHCGQA